ncbi:MAG: zf-HC2 domain-containing protein [Actinobacteria bacterium]|nr:zf-HC2 domain-containing protein [Actinomycetota bacterium]
MTMNCSEVRAVLPAYVEDKASLEVRRHLPGCQGCREELVRYQGVIAGLEELGGTPVDTPPGLAAALAELPFQGRPLEKIKTHVARNRPGYLASGLAALGATGAAGAALWYRHRGRAIAA